MKYRVSGSNRDTGARMTLEMEAESKAQAERKASQSGMIVNHVQDVSDGDVPHTGVDYEGSRRRRTGMHPLVKLVILVVIVGAVFYLWPQISGLVGR